MIATTVSNLPSESRERRLLHPQIDQAFSPMLLFRKTAQLKIPASPF